MILDSLLSFVPIGGALSLVGGAGVAIPSTNVIDLLGLGVGVNPAERIIGQNGATGAAVNFGEDSGLGAIKAQVQVNLGTTTFTNGTGVPTLNVAFQGAPDTGSAGGWLAGTWQTLVETGPLTVAQLNAAINNYPIARFDWPPAFPPNLQPRYLRLLFQLLTATSFGAGSVSSAVVTMVRDDFSTKYQPRNFALALG